MTFIIGLFIGAALGIAITYRYGKSDEAKWF